MVSPVETVITRLVSIGFYDFLLFLLALPILFAMLKKTKILGESPLINGIVAFVGAFLIFSFPIITGVSLTFSMTNMFMQLMMFVLVVFFGVIIASFFYPDLMGTFAKKFTSRSTFFVAVIAALVIAILSGFLPAVITAVQGPKAPAGPVLSPDITNFAGALIIFIVVLIIASAVTLRSD